MEVWNAFVVSIASVWADSGFAAFTAGNAIMIVVGCVLLWLAFAKEFEPLLLAPIAFGCIMANFPKTGFFEDPGLMLAIHYGIANEIFPPLIFLGIGAMTDFGPLIARPSTLLLGAAAQIGAFAVAAYSYMSLVPLIQPPVMKLLTTQKEREVVMEQMRTVTKFERICF